LKKSLVRARRARESGFCSSTMVEAAVTNPAMRLNVRFVRCNLGKIVRGDNPPPGFPCKNFGNDTTRLDHRRTEAAPERQRAWQQDLKIDFVAPMADAPSVNNAIA